MDSLRSQFEQLRPADGQEELSFRPYLDEDDLPDIMDLVERELSEPYVIVRCPSVRSRQASV